MPDAFKRAIYCRFLPLRAQPRLRPLRLACILYQQRFNRRKQRRKPRACLRAHANRSFNGRQRLARPKIGRIAFILHNDSRPSPRGKKSAIFIGKPRAAVDQIQNDIGIRRKRARKFYALRFYRVFRRT